MEKQLGYYIKSKESVLWLVFLPFIFIISIVIFVISIIKGSIYGGYFYDGAVFIIFLFSLVVWLLKLKKYKKAKTEKLNLIKNGKKYKGKIIKTLITTKSINKRGYKRYNKEVIEYEYYAEVEFTDDNGEKVTFISKRLNDNPEFASTKEVTVYTYENTFYATDFGYMKKTYVPPQKNWVNFS